ncbi:MAG: DUF4351 domain-containing protein [Cyanobacteria bacterium J06638_20]
MAKSLISRDLLQHWLNEHVRQAQERGIELGRRQGLKDGRQAGAAVVLQILLEHRLGTLDDDLRQWIADLSFSQLCSLAAQLPQLNTPAELHTWLEQA